MYIECIINAIDDTLNSTDNETSSQLANQREVFPWQHSIACYNLKWMATGLLMLPWLGDIISYRVALHFTLQWGVSWFVCDVAMATSRCVYVAIQHTQRGVLLWQHPRWFASSLAISLSVPYNLSYIPKIFNGKISCQNVMLPTELIIFC